MIAEVAVATGLDPRALRDLAAEDEELFYAVLHAAAGRGDSPLEPSAASTPAPANDPATIAAFFAR